jgi:hypothetical protein
VKIRYAALVLGLSALVHAGTIDVIVNSTDEPWDPTLAGNSSYVWTNNAPGYQTGPAVVNTVVSFTAGNQLVIAYLTGLDTTNAISVPGLPYVDGLGYTNLEYDSSDPIGMPADFIPNTPPPSIYLQEVLGTFTDGSGDIVGTPFVVGDGTTVTVPVGASALQLGVNDDYYYDNADDPNNPLTFSVSDQGNGTTQTPEPATFVLVGGALLAIGYRRARRHA